MINTAGFYRFDGEELRYGSTSVYAPNFTLKVQDKDTYQYPVFGWIYAASTEEAEQYFGLNGQAKEDWVAFSAALDTHQGVWAMLQAAPLPVALKLAVGLGKAADGDPTVFFQAWNVARSIPGLVPAELLQGVVVLAQQHQLPAEFVDRLSV